MERRNVQVHQLRVESSWMNPIVLLLKDDILPEEKGRLTKCEERLCDFGCLRTKSYTSALFLGHTCYASILKQ